MVAVGTRASVAAHVHAEIENIKEYRTFLQCSALICMLKMGQRNEMQSDDDSVNDL